MSVSKMLESYAAALTTAAINIGSGLAYIWAVMPTEAGKINIIIAAVVGVITVQCQRRKKANLIIEGKIAVAQLEKLNQEIEHKRRASDQ